MNQHLPKYSNPLIMCFAHESRNGSTFRTQASGPWSGVSLTLCCSVVYSTRRYVLCLTLYYFVLAFFSPFSIAIILLGEERTNFSAFRTFYRFALVWFCPFPLPLGVWEGLRFVIVALPGLFSYLFFQQYYAKNRATCWAFLYQILEFKLRISGIFL